jgi:poly(3-hydroxybutyrate) depolymerase
MDQRLDLRVEERQAVLAVPGDVEVDLAVVVMTHGVFGGREGGP